MKVWAVSLATTELSPRSLTSMKYASGIRSLIRIPGFLHGILFSALPPEVFYMPLALKLFRGEPAITKLD